MRPFPYNSACAQAAEGPHRHDPHGRALVPGPRSREPENAVPTKAAVRRRGYKCHAATAPADFAGCSLVGSGLSRTPRTPPECRIAGHAEAFDADTLWMDAIHTGKRVVLVCPRLNNLRADLRTARFRIDGHPVAASVREFKRHAIVQLASPEFPARVSIEIGDWRAESRVHSASPEMFRGRNVIFTLSKDNDLDWIHDFARFHHRHHRADAMLFVDNGSAAYGPDEIESAVKRSGIDRVLVLASPLNYGPRGKRPHLHDDQYLQSCVMNIARLRFLSRARAVLNCDVDELVHSRGPSIFDLAVRSPLGFVRFAGRWRYPAANLVGSARHAAHVFERPGGKICSEKWCIVPDGPLRHLQWRPHSLEPLPFARIFNTRAAGFWHCRAVSNDWKGYGRLFSPDDTVADPSIQSAMNAAGLE